MRVRFWGTRGSIAKPGPTAARYGGNTSCVEFRSNAGTLIMVDCGTGCHAFGQHLVAEESGPIHGHILISHTHWDHIQGMPFFEPLFAVGNRWDIYGPRGLSQGLRNTLAGQMEHTYFPITLDQFAATIEYHDLVEGTFDIDDVKVTTRYLNHPALTLGYRFEADGVSVVYCCDHEPHSIELASGDLSITGADRRHADFVAGADLVIHDAQYTAEEYPAKVGWGHSPFEYAVRVCQDAGVKKVLLTHHDPLRHDAAVDRIVEQARQRVAKAGASLEVQAAAEGQTFELTDAGTPKSKAQFPAQTALDDTATTRPVLLYLVDSQLTKQLSEAVASEGLPGKVLAHNTDLATVVLEDRPSLVLIEHDPPRIDGYVLARAIRQGENAGQIRVPLVIVTATGRQATRETGVATDWLTAPFSPSYARTRIRAWALRTACRWASAELPANEGSRLTALQNLAILDTRPEERFDRLTRIAAAAFNVPAALISLVDADRQWFKSACGLSVAETARDLSFCAHVVRAGREMIVPDTLLDDRFADNPLVVEEPRIRFYAGAPLVLDDGSCLGTLCLIDTRPRTLTERDMATLRDLRDLALEEIKRPPA
jgi:phosphoribosyl 1,2-cyclic phosphodiesterase/GAF domain-containing protein